MRIHSFCCCCCCCCCCWEISLWPSPCNHARNSFEKKMFWLSHSYKKLTLIFLSYPVPCHRLSFSAKINSGQELSAFFWYMHALTLNYPLQYAKRFSNIIAKNAAAMYTIVVWVISWAQWVYNTTQGFHLVSVCWHKLTQNVYNNCYYGSIVALARIKHKHEPSQGKFRLLEH